MSEGASLTVMAGPMAGTSLVIDDAVDEVLVGSDPDCRLSLDLPGVSPIHARVWRDLGGMTVYDTRSPRGIYVNDVRVVDQSPLHDGDVLWLGPPGDPDSVMLECRLPEESVLGAPAEEESTEAPVAAEAEVPAEGDAEVPPEAPDEARFLDSVDLPVDLPVAPPTSDAPIDEPFFFPPMEESAAGPADGEDSSRTVAVDLRTLFPRVVEAAPAAPVAPEPVPPAPVPVETAPAPREAALEDFVMDPAWADEASLEGPPVAPPPALDLDSLLAGEEPVAPAPVVPFPVVPVPPAPAPAPVPAAAAPPKPAPPAPAATAARTPTRPAAAIPPVTAPRPSPPAASPTPPPQRAVIDDTRARPTPRPFPAPPRREESEGVMDWARGNAAAPGPGTSPGAASPGPSVRPTARASRGPQKSGKLLPVVGAVVVAAALGGGYFAWKASSKPQIHSVTPARAAAGNVITLTGSHLGESAGETSVSVGGRPARVVQAGGGRLQIEVPEIATAGGHDASVPIVVTAGGRASEPAPLAVYLAPLLKSLLPDMAMPGENVVLTGTALGPGATVKFGDVPAQVVQAANGSLTVTVPALEARPGTEVPVVASTGGEPSNALKLLIGQVPLVTGIEPRSASPGDVVTVAGRGFAPRLLDNRVTVGGSPALVVNAGPRGIEFVVPRVIAGGGTVAIAVAGHTHVGQEEISITELPEPIGFSFVAEPFEDVPGHEHALVSSGIGLAFVLTTANGKPAAVRAVEAQKALNEAAQVLRSTRTAEIRARYAPSHAVYLFPRDTVLLDVTAADAEAYNEDWAHKGGRVVAVTPGRLVTWWEAVVRDLVLLLLRGEKPSNAPALAPEGKVLADLYDAARRTVAIGVPSGLIAGAKPPMRESLRAIGMRVPATVSAPSSAAVQVAGTPAAAASPVAPAFRLDGRWRGSETENGVRKPINMVFEGTSGTLTYERALSMSVPVLSVNQPQKGAIRFEIRVGGGTRFYRGQWDGARITGTMTSDAAGRTPLGTFQLDPAK